MENEKKITKNIYLYYIYIYIYIFYKHGEREYRLSFLTTPITSDY